MLEQHCKDLGRDFGEIVRSANYNVVIGRDQAEVDARLAGIEERGRPFLAPEILASSIEGLRGGPLVGTPELIVERLQQLRAAGMTYPILYFQEVAYDTSGLELFTSQVIPALAGS